MRLAISCAIIAALASPLGAYATGATPDANAWKSEICGAAPSSECVAANFDQLVQNAHKGNRYAINTVFAALSGCEHAPKSQDAVAAARITVTGNLPQANAEAIGRSHLNSIRVACQQYTPAQEALLPNFAWASAREGFGPAQIYLYGRLVAHDQAYASASNAGTSDSFLRHVDASAKAGSGTAQLVMSEAYRQGVIVKADQVKATAYYLAWNKNAAAGKESLPARLQGNLSSDQLNQAKQLAGNLTASIAQ